MADELTYHAVKWGGRSTGKLHTDRDCRHIKYHDDDELISGGRERFAADQDVCDECGP